MTGLPPDPLPEVLPARPRTDQRLLRPEEVDRLTSPAATDDRSNPARFPRVEGKPGEAGRLLELARQANLPVSVAAGDPAWIENAIAQMQAAARANTAPRTADFIGRDAYVASLFAPDLEKMSRLERNWQAIHTEFTRGQIQEAMVPLGTKLAFSPESFTKEDRARLNKLRDQAGRLPHIGETLSLPEQVLPALASQLTQLAGSYLEGLAAGGAIAGTAAAVVGAGTLVFTKNPALAGSAAAAAGTKVGGFGFVLGMATAAGRREGIHTFIELEDYEVDLGDGITVRMPHEAAVGAAMLVGALAGGLEVLPAEMLRRITPGLRFLGADGVKRLLTQQTTQRAFLDFATRYGAAILSEGATEAAQGVTSSLVQAVLEGRLEHGGITPTTAMDYWKGALDGDVPVEARVLNVIGEALDQNGLPPEAGAWDRLKAAAGSDVAAQAGAEGKLGMLVSFATGGIGGSMSLAGDLRRARRTGKFAEALDEMMAVAGETEAAKSAPNILQDALGVILEQETVHIDANEFAAHFEAMTDPITNKPVDAARMAGEFGIDAEAFAQARANNTTVAVESAAIIAKGARHEGIRTFLADIAQQTPGQMSRAQARRESKVAQRFLHILTEEGKQGILEADDPAKALVEEVRAGVAARLVSIGHSETDAAANAQLAGAMFHALHYRYGLPVEEARAFAAETQIVGDGVGELATVLAKALTLPGPDQGPVQRPRPPRATDGFTPITATADGFAFTTPEGEALSFPDLEAAQLEMARRREGLVVPDASPRQVFPQGVRVTGPGGATGIVQRFKDGTYLVIPDSNTELHGANRDLWVAADVSPGPDASPAEIAAYREERDTRAGEREREAVTEERAMGPTGPARNRTNRLVPNLRGVSTEALAAEYVTLRERVAEMQGTWEGIGGTPEGAQALEMAAAGQVEDAISLLDTEGVWGEDRLRAIEDTLVHLQRAERELARVEAELQRRGVDADRYLERIAAFDAGTADPWAMVEPEQDDLPFLQELRRAHRTPDLPVFPADNPNLPPATRALLWLARARERDGVTAAQLTTLLPVIAEHRALRAQGVAPALSTTLPEDGAALERFRLENGERMRLIRAEALAEAWGSSTSVDPAASSTVLEQRAFHSSSRPDLYQLSLRFAKRTAWARQYGHGIYVAMRKLMGEKYRQSLSGGFTIFGIPYGAIGQAGPAHDAWSALSEDYRTVAKLYARFLLAESQDAVAVLEGALTDSELEAYGRMQAMVADGSLTRVGHLYEVEVRDDAVARMLDYDGPLEAQPAEARAVLAAVGIDPGVIRTGEDIRRTMEYVAQRFVEAARLDPSMAVAARARLGLPPEGDIADALHALDVSTLPPAQALHDLAVLEEDAMVATSRTLAANGVMGGRYLDPYSQRDVAMGADPATAPRNLVIFDESVVEVVGRDGQPVTPEVRAAFIGPETLVGRVIREEAGVSGQPEGASSWGFSPPATTQPTPNAELDPAVPEATELGNAHWRGPTMLRAVPVRTGSVTLRGTKIESAADAVHAVADLVRHRATERMYGLVSDAAGKPLALVGGYTGGINYAMIPFNTFLFDMSLIEGGVTVDLIHNHPSGKSSLSSDDRQVHGQLYRTLRGSGLEVRSIAAVGAPNAQGISEYSLYDFTDSVPQDRSGFIAGTAQGATVDIIEREMRPAAAPFNADASGPARARTIIRQQAWSEDGIMLLDTQHQVVGFLQFSEAEAGRLRTEGRLLRLLRAIGSTNASAALVVTPTLSDQAANNLGFALQAMDLTVHDRLTGPDYASVSEQGINFPDAGLISRPFQQASDDPNVDPALTPRQRAARKAAATKRAKAEAVRQATPLQVLHNTTPEKLRYAFGLGGAAFPVPSLGITRKGQSFEIGGAITLIGRSHLGDPRTSPTFDGDAWTRTGQGPEYKAPAPVSAWHQLAKDLIGLAGGRDYGVGAGSMYDLLAGTREWSPRQVADWMRDAYTVAAAFLSTKGVTLPLPRMRDASTHIMLDRMVAAPGFLRVLAGAGLIDFTQAGALDLAAIGRLKDHEITALVMDLVLITQAHAAGLTTDEASVPEQLRSLASKVPLTLATMDIANELQLALGIIPGLPDPIGFGVWRSAVGAAYRKRFEPDAVDLEGGRQQAVRRAKSYQDYGAWLRGKVEPLTGESSILVHGKRLPYTLENVVKKMRARDQRGAENDMLSTAQIGWIRAFGSERFRSLERVRQRSGKIGYTATNHSTWGDIQNDVNDWVMDVFGTGAAGALNVYDNALFDQAPRVLARTLRTHAAGMVQGNPATAQDVQAAFIAEGFDATVAANDGLAVAALDIVARLYVAPVPLFEVKPQRAVAMSDFAGAVAPSTTPVDLLNGLAAQGMVVRTYNAGAGIAANRRAAVEALVDELAADGHPVLFQLKSDTTDWFRSQLLTALQGVKVKVQPAHQWLAWLNANAGKLGIKQEELEWSGVTDLLAMRAADRVTQEELVGWVEQNGVKIVVRRLRSNPRPVTLAGVPVTPTQPAQPLLTTSDELAELLGGNSRAYDDFMELVSENLDSRMENEEFEYYSIREEEGGNAEYARETAYQARLRLENRIQERHDIEMDNDRTAEELEAADDAVSEAEAEVEDAEAAVADAEEVRWVVYDPDGDEVDSYTREGDAEREADDRNDTLRDNWRDDHHSDAYDEVFQSVLDGDVTIPGFNGEPLVGAGVRGRTPSATEYSSNTYRSMPGHDLAEIDYEETLLVLPPTTLGFSQSIQHFRNSYDSSERVVGWVRSALGRFLPLPKGGEVGVKLDALYLEETQSDWAQQGRDQGWYDPTRKARARVQEERWRVAAGDALVAQRARRDDAQETYIKPLQLIMGMNTSTSEPFGTTEIINNSGRWVEVDVAQFLEYFKQASDIGSQGNYYLRDAQRVATEGGRVFVSAESFVLAQARSAAADGLWRPALSVNDEYDFMDGDRELNRPWSRREMSEMSDFDAFGFGSADGVEFRVIQRTGSNPDARPLHQQASVYPLKVDRYQYRYWARRSAPTFVEDFVRATPEVLEEMQFAFEDVVGERMETDAEGRIHVIPRAMARERLRDLARVRQLYRRKEKWESAASVSTGGQAPGPWVQSTQAWVGLVVKAAIKRAVEANVDYIAWTDGLMQARRWSQALQKAVKHIDWTHDPATDLYVITGEQPDGNEIPPQQVTSKALTAMVGSALADQMRDAVATGLMRDRIEGSDLTIAAGGMIAFYDQILPSIIRDVSRKLGGDGVILRGNAESPSGARVDDSQSGSNMAIRVTDKMRAKAADPFPLFRWAEDPRASSVQGRYFKTAAGRRVIQLAAGADGTTFLHELSHFFFDILEELAVEGRSAQAAADVQLVRDWQVEALPKLRADAAHHLPRLARAAGVVEPRQIEGLLRRLGEADAVELEGYVRARTRDTQGDPVALAMRVAAEEHWARAFERFLYTTRAPSAELRRPFRHYKAWLKAAYGDPESLKAVASPEVADMMRRLLATDEALAAAEAEVDRSPMPWGLVPEGKQAEYAELLAEARRAAEERLQQELLAETTAERRAERDKMLAEFREEALETLKLDPAYRLRVALESSRTVDGEALPAGLGKIDRAAALAVAGPDVVRRINGRLLRNNGAAPSVVADAFGFPSVTAMLEALAATKPLHERADAMAAEQLAQRAPELIENPEALSLAAIRALHGEAQDKVSRFEAEWLAENAAGTVSQAARAAARILVRPAREVRALAQAALAALRLRDVHPESYRRAEVRAHNEAVRLAQRGDLRGAALMKEQERLASALWREAEAFRRELPKRRRAMMKAFGSDKKIAATRALPFVYGMRALLAQYGMGRDTKTPEQYLAAAEAFAPDDVQDMRDLLLSMAAPANTPMTELTVAQFDGLYDAAMGLWTKALRVEQFDTAEGRIAMRDAIAPALEVLAGWDPAMGTAGIAGKFSASDHAKEALLSAASLGARVLPWIKMMDNNDLNGPFHRLFSRVFRITPVLNAAITEYRAKLGALATAMGKVSHERIEAPELTTTLEDGTQVAYAWEGIPHLLGGLLHAGNEGNLAKNLLGRGWTLAGWEQFLDRMYREGKLEQRHLDFVQGTWDLFEELRPQLWEAAYELRGWWPKEVQPRPLVTPFGTYRGGYMPAKRDPELDTTAEDRALRNSFEETHGFSFPVQVTGGMTLERTGAVGPLWMDFQLADRHVIDALRFIHLAVPVRQMSRVLTDREFAAGLRRVNRSWLTHMLTPWLERVATQEVEATVSPRFKMLARWAGILRRRATLSVMALNVPNTIEQFTGTQVARSRVKSKHLRLAHARFLASPRAVVRGAYALSDFLRDSTSTRMADVQREIRNILIDASVPEQMGDALNRHGYILQRMTQAYVNVVVWTGAFDEAVAQGYTEEQAIGRADDEIRLTQGGFGPEDISTIEAGNAFARLFTTFTGWFNTIANLNAREAQRITREMGLKDGAIPLVRLYWFGFFIPIVVSRMIRNAFYYGGMGVGALGMLGDDDDEDGLFNDAVATVVGSQVSAVTAMVPIVGPAFQQTVINRFDDLSFNDRLMLSPVVGMLEQTGAGLFASARLLGEKVGTVEEARRNDFLDAFGLLTLLGVPTAAGRRAGRFLRAVDEGSAEPTGPIDFTRGLMSGR